MNAEKRTVKCGEGVLTYYLTRKNVKNVNMRVKADGSIHISAPPRVTIYFIEEFIRSKYDYIISSIERLNAEDRKTRTEASEDELIPDGGRLSYLGDDYTVRIRFGEDDSVDIDGSEIVVKTYDTENTAFANMLIRNWLTNRTAELFGRLNDEVSEEIGIEKVPIKLRSMKSRWGSCHITDKFIVMNTRLIHYPERSVKYVFVHEYCHFLVPNHSKLFYKTVAAVMPDYKVWAEKLK
jgi:hypothetical protein